MKLDFLRHISKKAQISNFIKIRPVGTELYHADRRTDMTKLTVAFRNFANKPENELRTRVCCRLHIVHYSCGHKYIFVIFVTPRLAGNILYAPQVTVAT